MPDTSTFLVYGYIVILGILAAYILSLAIKGKKILKKLDQIQSKKIESKCSLLAFLRAGRSRPFSF
jgi:hypothetical protein